MESATPEGTSEEGRQEDAICPRVQSLGKDVCVGGGGGGATIVFVTLHLPGICLQPPPVAPPVSTSTGVLTLFLSGVN